MVFKAAGLSGSGVHIMILVCSGSPFKRASFSGVKQECFSHLLGKADKRWVFCFSFWMTGAMGCGSMCHSLGERMQKRIGVPSVALARPYFQSCGSSPAEKPETSAGLQYTLQQYILVITGRRGSIYIHFFTADTLKWSKHE